MNNHIHDSFFKACLIFAIAFTGFYFISELVQFKIWWYFPLEHQWEYAIIPSEGLKMGWYGKIFLSTIIAIPCSSGSYFIFKFLKTKQKEVQTVLDLMIMSIIIFTLYFLAYSMATRELKPLPEPLHSHEPLHEF